MAKIVRLTESDLNRLVKKVIKEDESEMKEPLRSYEDYKYELDHYMENLKSVFNDLMDLEEMVMNDNNLSEEEKDDITWTIGQTFDDPYGMFLQD
jgi:hypothetical protein